MYKTKNKIKPRHHKKGPRPQFKNRKRFKVVRRVFTGFDRLFRKRLRALRLLRYYPKSGANFVAVARSAHYLSPRFSTAAYRSAGLMRATPLKIIPTAVTGRAAQAYILAGSPSVRYDTKRSRAVIVSALQRRLRYLSGRKYRRLSAPNTVCSFQRRSSTLLRPRERVRRFRVLRYRALRSRAPVLRSGVTAQAQSRWHRCTVSLRRLRTTRSAPRRRKKYVNR